ncbi:MAG: pantoate--beta-alanine ligase, partial [Pseudomonadota bacterium]
REAGCDLLFAPPPSEMYPPGFATEVRVRGLADVLCGAARPGHFDGVAQVVTKLLNQAGADRAIFGEKDWQQLAIIRRLARDLDIPTEILGAPILREPDGLALSSRNRYLSEIERSIAPALFSVLSAVGSRFRRGHSAQDAVRGAEDELVSAGFERVDYVEIRDGVTLAPIDGDAAGHPAARVFGAAHLGRARLIDNIAVAGADTGSGVRATAEGAR